LLGDNGNIPQTFLINRQGKLVSHLVGFSETRASELQQFIESELQSPP